MFDAGVSDDLHERVQRLIDDHAHEESAAFDALASDIARHQANSSPPIARLFLRRGVDPLALARAADVPAVPTDAFKLTRIAAHPPALDVAVFRTSGTTSGARGEHALRRTDTYARGALVAARRLLVRDMPAQRHVVALMPAPTDLAESSLGFMCGLFGRELASRSTFHLREGSLDLVSLERAIAEAHAAGSAVLLLSTSFALVHLLDELSDRTLPLPAGSLVMQTGGYKGKSREIAPAELRAAAARAFATTESQIVAEYGMTELSSQAYESREEPDSREASAVYASPPWMRVVPVDPVTLAPVPYGSSGIARVVDLANVDSAVAVQTQDLVTLVAGGFRLHGRLPGATPRGCSLSIEELLPLR